MAEMPVPPAKALSRGRRRREGENYFLYLTWDVGGGGERRTGKWRIDPSVKGKALRARAVSL